MNIDESKLRRRRTSVNAPILHPVRRKSRVRRSPWRSDRTSGHFCDITAPNGIVAGHLLEIAVKANVLNKDLTLRAAKMVVIILERIEDWALAYTILRVRAGVDCSLEN